MHCIFYVFCFWIYNIFAIGSLLLTIRSIVFNRMSSAHVVGDQLENGAIATFAFEEGFWRCGGIQRSEFLASMMLREI